MATKEEIAGAKAEIDRRKAAKQSGKPSATTTGKAATTSGTAKVSTSVMPYGTDPAVLKLLQDYKIKGASDLYGKLIGKQSKSQQGYGEDITLDEWKASNPSFVKDFESKYGTFDPANEDHVKKYEDWHYKDTYDKIYAKNIANGESETKAKENAKKVADNLSFVKDSGDVRDADHMFGIYHRSRKELAFEDVPANTKEVKTITDDAKPGSKAAVNHLDNTIRSAPKAKWWLQDMIGLAGAVSDFSRVKKYPPWQAVPDVIVPDVHYYDPNRELAQSSEQANALIQNLAQFSGPQALSARASQIQGNAAEQAANILGRYNSLNVGVANQYEQQRAAILNQAAQQRAGLATNLYDKNTIANQQWNTARNQARQNIRSQFQNAITNRAYTQNLNTLYPQYNVDPWGGGNISYTGVEKKVIPEESTEDLIKKFMKAKESLPNVQDAVVWAMVKGDTSENDDTDLNAAYLKSLKGMYPST